MAAAYNLIKKVYLKNFDIWIIMAQKKVEQLWVRRYLHCAS